MTIAGVFALLLTLLAVVLLARRRPEVLGYYALLGGTHVAATFVAWRISLADPADALNYYNQASYPSPFGISSSFIIFLTRQLRELFGASYLDAFLLFQLPGLIGIILLHQAATRLAQDEFGVRVGVLALLLFMPGLHFWTTAIGKDGLAILAYGMIALSLSRERFHWGLLGAGVLLYFLIRPHVGFVVMLAMMLAFLPVFGRSRGAATLIGMVCLVMVALLMPFVIQLIGLEAQGLSQIGSFVETRQGYNQSGGSSIDLGAQAPPVRVFTFLFRPLFFDTSGALGLLVSVENLFLLGIVGFLIWHLGRVMALMRLSEVLRFHAFFALIMTVVLSQILGNLGLAVRQKMMVIPAIFLIFTALIALRNRQRADLVDEISARVEEDRDIAVEPEPGLSPR